MNASGTLRERMRAATTDAHLRLHRHDGLAAAARGEISIEDYALLLARLFGFHRALETAVASAPEEIDRALDLSTRARSRLIESDLLALGWGEDAIASFPLCPQAPIVDSAPRALGALYVLEGSTLGGAQIAKALGSVTTVGRRFFAGYNDRNAQMWRGFLAQLEQVSGAPELEAQAIDAARDTFDIFATWMAGWRVALRDRAAGRS